MNLRKHFYGSWVSGISLLGVGMAWGSCFIAQSLCCFTSWLLATGCICRTFSSAEALLPCLCHPATIQLARRVPVLADPACGLAGASPSSRGHKDDVSQEFCVQSSKVRCLCELFYQIWKHLIDKTHLKLLLSHMEVITRQTELCGFLDRYFLLLWICSLRIAYNFKIFFLIFTCLRYLMEGLFRTLA